MEKIGHFLDMENERLFRLAKSEGLQNNKISELIAKDIDIAAFLKESGKSGTAAM